MVTEHVIIEHQDYYSIRMTPRRRPHLVTVRDLVDRSVVFVDTPRVVATWLAFFDFHWTFQNGVWERKVPKGKRCIVN